MLEFEQVPLQQFILIVLFLAILVLKIFHWAIVWKDFVSPVTMPNVANLNYIDLGVFRGGWGAAVQTTLFKLWYEKKIEWNEKNEFMVSTSLDSQKQSSQKQKINPLESILLQKIREKPMDSKAIYGALDAPFKYELVTWKKEIEQKLENSGIRRKESSLFFLCKIGIFILILISTTGFITLFPTLWYYWLFFFMGMATLNFISPTSFLDFSSFQNNAVLFIVILPFVLFFGIAILSNFFPKQPSEFWLTLFFFILLPTYVSIALSRFIIQPLEKMTPSGKKFLELLQNQFADTLKTPPKSLDFLLLGISLFGLSAFSEHAEYKSFTEKFAKAQESSSGCSVGGCGGGCGSGCGSCSSGCSGGCGGGCGGGGD